MSIPYIRGWETRNRDVRQGTEDGRKGTDTWDRRHRTLDKGRENGAGERMPRKRTLFNSKKNEKWKMSIRGTHFIAGWAYEEMISSQAEHTWKCSKVEYLGRTEYNFYKSLVTGPWDHKVLVSAKKSTNKFHACVPLSCSKVISLWLPF